MSQSRPRSLIQTVVLRINRVRPRGASRRDSLQTILVMQVVKVTNLATAARSTAPCGSMSAARQHLCD
jgi:hypothetical protein